eukprot:1159719-Pelagomonas_calceolata.AAC.3
MSIVCTGCTLLLHTKACRRTIPYNLRKGAAQEALCSVHSEGVSGSFPYPAIRPLLRDMIHSVRCTHCSNKVITLALFTEDLLA